LGDAELHKRIDDLRLEIELEQENYKTAVLSRFTFPLLKQMRLNIKRLRGDLKVLTDQQAEEH